MRDWISPRERARLKRIEEIQKRRQRRASLIGQILMILLIVGLALGSVFNIYVIVNRVLREKGYPRAFGVTPIVVAPSEDAELEDVVYPGDLLFAFEQDLEKYQPDEIIAYTYNGIVLIGIIDSSEVDSQGVVRFIIWATAHESVYEPTATLDNLLGEIQVRIPLIGYFVLFLGTLPGRIIFVGIPLMVYIILMLIGFYEDYAVTRQGGESEFPKHRRKPVPGIPVAAATAAKAPRQTVPKGRPASEPSGAWLYLTTIVMTMAAIAYGTYDFKNEEKLDAKRLAARAAAQKGKPAPCPCQAAVLSALSDQGDPAMSRPVKIQPTRAIRPRRSRSVRPVTPRKVAPVKAITTTRDNVITGGR